MTCASTSLRISVIARCAATPRTCELANAVPASTSVAAPVASASVGSRSQLPFVMTSSIKNFVVVGSTRPDSRLMSMRKRPRERRARCFQTSARASSQAPGLIPFFFPIVGSVGRVLRGMRSACGGTRPSYDEGKSQAPTRTGRCATESNKRTMSTLFHDLRYGARLLAKTPGFTLIAPLSLALVIGANTTIFTLVNAVLLTPLPVEDPSRLVSVFATDERNQGTPGFDFLQLSPLNFADLRDKNEVFSAMTAHQGLPLSISGGTGDPQQIFGEIVAGN